MRGNRFLIATTAAVPILGISSIQPAGAARTGCGQTITQSTTLERDLTCGQDGLIVAGNNIILDLNGHTVSGVLSSARLVQDPPDPPPPGLADPPVSYTVKFARRQSVGIRVRGNQ